MIKIFSIKEIIDASNSILSRETKNKNNSYQSKSSLRVSYHNTKNHEKKSKFINNDIAVKKHKSVNENKNEVLILTNSDEKKLQTNIPIVNEKDKIHDQKEIINNQIIIDE